MDKNPAVAIQDESETAKQQQNINVAWEHNGRLEQAVNSTEAIKLCPYLGRLAMESPDQASALLNLASMDFLSNHTQQEPPEVVEERSEAQEVQSFSLFGKLDDRSPETKPIPEIYEKQQVEKSLDTFTEQIILEQTRAIQTEIHTEKTLETATAKTKNKTKTPKKETPKQVKPAVSKPATKKVSESKSKKPESTIRTKAETPIQKAVIENEIKTFVDPEKPKREDIKKAVLPKTKSVPQQAGRKPKITATEKVAVYTYVKPDLYQENETNPEAVEEIDEEFVPEIELDFKVPYETESVAVDFVERADNGAVPEEALVVRETEAETVEEKIILEEKAPDQEVPSKLPKLPEAAIQPEVIEKVEEKIISLNEIVKRIETGKTPDIELDREITEILTEIFVLLGFEQPDGKVRNILKNKNISSIENLIQDIQTAIPNDEKHEMMLAKISYQLTQINETILSILGRLTLNLSVKIA